MSNENEIETVETIEEYSDEEFPELEDPVETDYIRYSDKQIKNELYKKNADQKEVKKFLTKLMGTKIIYSSDDLYIRFLYDQLTTLRYSETNFNTALRIMLYGQEYISVRDVIKLIDDNFGFC